MMLAQEQEAGVGRQEIGDRNQGPGIRGQGQELVGSARVHVSHPKFTPPDSSVLSMVFLVVVE